MSSVPLPDAIPSTACAARELVGTYLLQLRGFNIDELASKGAQGLGATTLLIVGACLVLGPVALGRDWLMRVLWLLAALIGAVGADWLVSGAASGHVGTGVAILSLDDEGACWLNLIVILVAAIGLGSLATKMIGLAIFGAGAAAGGYAATLGLGIAQPFAIANVDGLEAEHFEKYAWAVVGAVGLASGYIVASVARTLVDTVCGVLGAFLVSHGLLELAMVSPLLDEQLARQLKLEEYFAAYVLGLTLFVFSLRGKLVDKREGGDALIMR